MVVEAIVERVEKRSNKGRTRCLVDLRSQREFRVVSTPYPACVQEGDRVKVDFQPHGHVMLLPS